MKKDLKIIPCVEDNTIKIEDDICWDCGKTFNRKVKNDRRTYHHSIPQRYNPLYNVLIPICFGCHAKMNREDQIYKRGYHTVRGFFMITDDKIAQRIKKLDIKNGNNKLQAIE